MFGLGLLGSSNAGIGSHGIGVHSSGETASFGFSHFVCSQVAAEVRTAVIGGNATIGSASVTSNVVMPVLFGLSYSPRALALTKAMRPYVSAAAGPYIHCVGGLTDGGVGASSEAAAGARLGAGVNVFTSSHLAFSFGADYHAVSRFEHSDAATDHANGLGMSVAVGATWGGR